MRVYYYDKKNNIVYVLESNDCFEFNNILYCNLIMTNPPRVENIKIGELSHIRKINYEEYYTHVLLETKQIEY